MTIFDVLLVAVVDFTNVRDCTLANPKLFFNLPGRIARREEGNDAFTCSSGDWPHGG